MKIFENVDQAIRENTSEIIHLAVSITTRFPNVRNLYPSTMIHSFKVRAALRLADFLRAGARESRVDLREHVRGEQLRLRLARKRVRGLRLYAAWVKGAHFKMGENLAVTWQPAEISS